MAAGQSVVPSARTDATSGAAHRNPDSLRLLVYSDDANTRRRVVLAVGTTVGADLPALQITEVATAWAVRDRIKRGEADVLVLDGEAAGSGGLGLCRTIKEEVYQAPPVLVILGRPQDSWLAAWSHADGVAMHPIEPVAMAEAVATFLREAGFGAATPDSSLAPS